ncbi:hypothetical protein CH333_01485 [candidate division WOR-3 bacterium JGI_Cruoil_03_44_89]|uniref:DUF2089 domain-containing protein n=1 Tax=candidate division WOR-3 bacterium JGI_Cruoil_03_44_89 TaxID=1973748 RepID=A0A235BY34_UNCW3|nr:MAG: hypothetical protein CH333_01485 [candidate division WOR-3 bacterium JGI_Cruoil_03_44_89]
MKIINKCPFCGGELLIKKFSCRECGTEVVGEFERSKFCRLSPELLEFVEVFILNEGNIKGVEETLGCSYPKVKNMLREVIQALGYEYKYGKAEERRKEILDMLEMGEITAEEAKELLDKI